MKKLKTYFQNFSKPQHIIFTVLLTVLAILTTVVAYSSNLIDYVIMSEKFFTFSIGTAGFFSLMVLIYVYSNFKNNKISIFDYIALTMIAVGILYLLLFGIIYKTLGTVKILVSLLLVVLGVGFILLHANYFEKENDKKESSNPFIKYCKEILSKYNVLLIMLFALAVISVAFIAINPSMKYELSTGLKIFWIITAVLFALFASANCVKSEVGIIDALLFSFVFIFPVTLYQILLTNKNKGLNLLVWGVILVMIAVLLACRFSSFKDKTKQKLFPEKNIKCKLFQYFYDVIKSYGIFSTLFIGFLLASSIVMMFSFEGLTQNLQISKAGFRLSPKIIPMGIICLVCIITLLSNEIFSIISIRSKDLKFSDFGLTINLIAVIVGFITLTTYFSIAYLIILLSELVIFFLTVFFRAKYYKA